MNIFYKKSKLCTGKNDLLCPIYAQKEKLDYSFEFCPKCNSELAEIQEINKKFFIMLSLTLLLFIVIISYNFVRVNEDIKTNTQTNYVKIEPVKLINEYSGNIEIDTMKFLAIHLKIKDIIYDDNGNCSFNFDLNTKDFRDKGLGKIYPLYNKISFNSSNLNYNFNGDYKYQNNKIIIIGDNKKWQVRSK